MYSSQNEKLLNVSFNTFWILITRGECVFKKEKNAEIEKINNMLGIQWRVLIMWVQFKNALVVLKIIGGGSFNSLIRSNQFSSGG